MKRLLLLVLALCLCSGTYAKMKTIVYKIKKENNYVYITCRGNFTNGVLSDGPVIFSYDRITLTGIYRSDSTYTLYGTIKNHNWDMLLCYGTICNNKENRTISKKSSANDWEIDLQFYTFIDNAPQIKAVIDKPFHATSEFSAERIAINLAWEQLYPIIDQNRHNATVYFPDGCKYIGPIYRPRLSSAWGIGIDEDYKTPFDYQYVWPNGDSFKGKIYDREGAPNPLKAYSISGCFQLVDGSTLDYKDYKNDQGHCHSYKYYADKNKEYIQQYPCPSQLFPILKERQQKDDAEKREEELRQEKERKLEQEARLKKKREQQAKAEQRRKLLIRKYGQKWGELLAQGKIELGMTKQMCQEVVNIKFYDISKSNYFGRTVETWMYNQDKVEMSAEGFLGMALLKGFADAFGLPTPPVVQYTYLVFSDGELTSIQ